ncbi:MAG: hypothetical protein RMK29_12820 [Myxococcales bacterium]|nr:hypothetical protein [Myxococcales bacterium]
MPWRCSTAAVPPPPDRDGERQDPATERVLRDWMNFLSFGFTPTATGTSDTHGIVRPAGMPRSLVRVSDDSPAAIAAGIGEEVVRTVSGQGGAPRDVIVTNGPFLQLWVGEDPARGGIGRTVSLSGSKLRITAEVRTVQWAPVDTLEVFANSTFLDNGTEAEPLVPALCFTSRPMISARCRAAVVSGPLHVVRVDEGSGRVYLRARVEVEVDVEQLLARNRPGARGRDLWLVARAFGDRALFPVLPGGLDRKVSIASLLDGPPVTTSGLFPLAFTNPVFVDVDGGGWRGPFQP